MTSLDGEPWRDDPAQDVPDAFEGPLPADGLLDPIADLPEEPSGPVCGVCGTPVAGGQDWCLECGTAVTAPRRLPGARAVVLAGALALVLAGGAVAASYAALTEKRPPPATKVETVAQTTPLPTTTVEPTTDLEPLPPLDEPSTDVQPLDPIDTGIDEVPATTTPGTTTTTTTEKKAAPIVIAAGAGSLYDPAARATATGDPERAIDGVRGSSWFVTTPEGADMAVGYLLDLGEKTDLARLELLTKTSGFTLQVFGSPRVDPPPTADDPLWTKLAEAGSVDGKPPDGAAGSVPAAKRDKRHDGKIELKLADVGKRFRQVLLWVTIPPREGTTVRFNEIRLFSQPN